MVLEGNMAGLSNASWRSGAATAPPNWQDLSTEHLRTYLRHEFSGRKRQPSNLPIVALRTMLRFLAVRGLTQLGLEETLPRIRCWRHATLPARLSCADVDRLIKCAGDAATFQPLRDTAIMLLAKTGLRVQPKSLASVWMTLIGPAASFISAKPKPRPAVTVTRHYAGGARLAGIPQTGASFIIVQDDLPASDSAVAAIHRLQRDFQDRPASPVVRADIAPTRGAAHAMPWHNDHANTLIDFQKHCRCTGASIPSVHRHLREAGRVIAVAHRHAVAGREVMSDEELQELLSRYVEYRSCWVIGKPIADPSHASFRTLSTITLVSR
ncbi:hypothetical protein BRCH_01769 [Candidatus Burkholderia brachyanthoides]|nr:hypothetical protein BRCH_01769 [Candidatus Burkholderia brachyanthoides]